MTQSLVTGEMTGARNVISMLGVEPSGLGPDEVHVWLARTSDTGSSSTSGALATRAELLARRKREQAMSGALLRHTLSRYCSVHYRDWKFTYNDFGRPEIAPGLTSLPLRFNLSHTTGLIVCGVTLGRDVGVDVESLDIPDAGQHLAARYFALHERQEIADQPPSSQRELFLFYWTLKEAFLKAIGRGLSVPLDKVRFRLHATQVVADFDVGLTELPSAWQFEHYRPTARHHLAVAARCGGGAGLRVHGAWVALDQIGLVSCI